MNRLTTLFFASTLLITFTLLAQENPNATMKPVKLQKFTLEEKAKNATDTLQKVTGLTDDQYKKAYDLNLTYYKQKKENKDKMRMDTTSMEPVNYKELESKLKKDRKAAVYELLDETQKIKWEEYKKSKSKNKNNDLKQPEQDSSDGM